MAVSLFFNELSVQKMDSLHESHDLMTKFIELLKHAFATGAERGLKIDENFWNYEIAESYALRDWRIHVKRIDKEVNDYITGLLSRLSYIDESKLLSSDCDYLVHDQKAIGVAAAHEQGGLAVSLLTSKDKWDCPLVKLDIQSFDNVGEISSYLDEICHASRISHIDFHRSWIADQSKPSLNRGKDIWEQQSVYTNLVFCPNVESQLKNIGPNHTWLKSIVGILELMQSSTEEDWNASFQEGRLRSYRMSDESEATMNQRKHREQRTFTDTDGIPRLCSWHVKGPNLLRIHFIRNGDKTIIGHVGGHLPTDSDPH